MVPTYPSTKELLKSSSPKYRYRISINNMQKKKTEKMVNNSPFLDIIYKKKKYQNLKNKCPKRRV